MKPTQQSNNMQNEARVLVGAATRYIAGRNAVQTVYWRTKESSDTPTKMLKVSKTFTFAKSANQQPPNHVRQEQKIMF